MKMKKIILLFVISISLIFSSCAFFGKYPEVKPMKNYKRIMEQSSDKFQEGRYAGYLVQIRKDSILVNTENEIFEYFFTETSRKNFKLLELKKGNQIFVNFEKDDDGRLIATDLEKIIE